MNDTPIHPKPSTGPRKNGRQNARPAAQKAYASENDVSKLEVARTAPQTPGKMRNGSNPARDAEGQHGTDVKQRSKPRNKAKNIPSSPEYAQRGSQTPPQRVIPVKPGMNTAFAGATFHASPAPSALPIPSFLSKPSGESPSGHRTNASHGYSPPDMDQEIPTPLRASSLPKTNESPLDFMFRAHREEKERGVQNNSKHMPLDQPFSHQSRGTSQAHTEPQPRRTFQMQYSGGIDVAELDGTPGRPMGPAFSTPYQERINAARSNAGNTTRIDGYSQTTLPNPPQETDPTDALKKFLFGGTGPTAPAATPTKGGSNASPGSSQRAFGGDGQVEAVYSQSSRVEAMENDLRRILKLDSTSKYSS